MFVCCRHLRASLSGFTLEDALNHSFAELISEVAAAKIEGLQTQILGLSEREDKFLQ